MTELNCEENKSSLYHIDNKGVGKVVLIYGLLVFGLGAILNSDVLFGYLDMFNDAVQPVINKMISHCPVEVKMPAIPLGPSWSSSGNNL
ncbi:hypothetical protein [Yersinia mollaretii]|uniref:Uncharacterized protein n=1 Tax=Yersinia mollaretii TaxID=33060 RepID=A0AA36LN49_YERMO|nr:hypothetical protein [Yersinia mollaretii]MDA5525446.1 nuclease [Yersinia mollaretii]MDA5535233.1 nuclease [Yersinia mollaretii]MDR7872840.1 nuclease [Yersinia mollaretii]WQC75974.1 nuclease [Yersinia mollaretii]CNE31527.1 Uncharacterised protein [Yersinia mollaretii]